LALASLAVWRVTHLLAEEDGPADAVLRERARLGASHLGELMDCFMCLCLRVAAPASVAVTRRRRVSCRSRDSRCRAPRACSSERRAGHRAVTFR
jgi:hypothetical protein